MNRAEILNSIKAIMEDVFDRKPLTITEHTKAADIEEWDSLSHIQVVVAIEKHFKVKFTTREIQAWKNVGEIITGVENKLKTA